MKNLKDIATKKRQSIRDEATKERKKLKVLETVAANWPEGVEVHNVYPSDLYGSIAHIQIGDTFSSYGTPDSRVSLERVAELLDLFAPLPLALIKDGCTSIRPEETLTEKEWTKIEAEGSKCITGLWGVIVKAEPGINSGGEKQGVSWYTKLVSGEVIRIDCELLPASRPVEIRTQTRSDRSTGKVLEVLSTEAIRRGGFWLDQRLKWSAGSHEYASSFTFYWIGIDDTLGAGRTWLETICHLPTENIGPHCPNCGENFEPTSADSHKQLEGGYSCKGRKAAR